MTTTEKKTTRPRLMPDDNPLVTEAEGVARVAAAPAEITLFPSEDRAARHIVLPPDWTSVEVPPVPPRTAPDRLTGTTTVITAQGFVDACNSLRVADEGTTHPGRFLATKTTLTGIINPGTLAAPAYEDLIVVLAPKTSDELKQWIALTQTPLSLDSWERWVQDLSIDIDAAHDENDTAPTGLDVLTDARKWEVESKRASQRIRSEAGEADDVEAYESRITGEALASFKIRLPILTHGEPFTLIVVIDRDLERKTIKPRIPTVQRVIDRAIENEIGRAEDSLSIDAIR